MLVVKGMLMGMLIAFGLWCMYEVVAAYRWERRMQTMESMIKNGALNWLHLAKNKVKPLFWEQFWDQNRKQRRKK